MKPFKILFAFLFVTTLNLAYANAPMSLETDTSSLQLNLSNSGIVNYTLTNHANSPLSGISIDPSYGGGNPGSFSLSNDTCSGTTLDVSASCTFDVTVYGTKQPAEFSLSPRACARNGTVCAQAAAGSRPTVYVAQVSHQVSAYIAFADTPASTTRGPILNTISPITVPSLTVNSNITGFNFDGTSSVGLTLSPDGNTLYVSNYGANTLEILDVSGTPTLTHTVDVGSSPLGVAVSPNNQTAYVCNEGSSSVSVVDLNTFAVETISLLIQHRNPDTYTVGSPRFVTVNPNNTLFYVSDNSNLVIRSYSTSDLSPYSVSSSTGDYGYLTPSPDGSTLYAIDNIADEVSVFDANTLCLTQSFSPSTITNESACYAQSSKVKRCLKQPTNLHKDSEKIPPLNPVHSLAVSPDGNTLYVGTSNGIYLYNTSDWCELSPHYLAGSSVNGMALDPTGTYLIVEATGLPLNQKNIGPLAGQIFEINTSTEAVSHISLTVRGSTLGNTFVR